MKKEDLKDTIQEAFAEFIKDHRADGQQGCLNCWDEIVDILCELSGMNPDRPWIQTTAAIIVDGHIELDSETSDGPLFPVAWIEEEE